MGPMHVIQPTICRGDIHQAATGLRMAGALLSACVWLLPVAAHAAPLNPQQTQAIDDSVQEWLASTGAPSVSIAVVEEGVVAYARAYGKARLDPARIATTDTRYAVDSVSKEFTASAILMLQQAGKLQLDDPVSRFLPTLGGAPVGSVTIRQLLSHTAGLRDYWPQDYVPSEMIRPTSTTALLDEWARKPLDFKPGTDWQYSNTGYVVAGAIAEKLSGEALVPFLQARIFQPLHMTHVVEDDTAPLPQSDAGAYTRYGMGPVRSATKEGRGWLFAASELAMTATDLARWDVSLIDRSLLSGGSYEALTRTVKLASGSDTHYGLGVEVQDDQGRREISHDGAGSGFLAANAIWPGAKVAVVALTNNDWASPSAVIDRVAFVALPPTETEAPARSVFDDFQHGRIDRGRFTENANAYLTPAVLADQAAGLSALGPLRLMKLSHSSNRGGMRILVWSVTTTRARVTVVERTLPDGRIEQFMVTAPD